MALNLLPLLGLREGWGHVPAGCWLHMCCILRDEETFILKQSSPLEFKGLPSSVAFHFGYVLSLPCVCPFGV